MLTTVAYALAIAAVVVTVRWWGRRVDALGRRRRFPYVSVALLAVLAAGAATPGILRAREERTLSRVASVLAGHRVHVHCQTVGEEITDAGPELGKVYFTFDGKPLPKAILRGGACRDLAAYLRSGKRHPSSFQAIAVHVLTHESMHLGGIQTESVAECAAVHRDAETARLLGAPPDAATALARWYFAEVYPRMPDEYRDAACTL